MLAVPPALLEQLQIQNGATVGLALDQGRLVVEPLAKPHYTLAELLAQSDYSQAASHDDRAWTTGAAIGQELI